ncbi:thiol:disulfide interchange protein, partial [Klebsiella pneumoniae]|nr:thiol:disulfide interchange protein [Klebsiella pneumoniae]
PDDVSFRRVPAMFGGVWNVHGQLFVTLEAMGVEQKVHEAIFATIHNGQQKLATPEEMADFLANQGVDREKFLSTYNSFAVK